MFSAGMPAAPNRSSTFSSTPHVMGLMKPSGGGGDKVACDVDAEHVRSQLCLRHRSGAVSATEIEDIEPRRDSQVAGESLTALAHRGRDPREVTLLPQRLVRIDIGLVYRHAEWL